MNRKIITTILFFLLFWATTTLAQDNECINFDDNIEHGTYGIATGLMPGSLLFTDDGVSVRVKNFEYFNGTEDFINVFVSDDDIFGGVNAGLVEGSYIFPSNINLDFDFTNLPTGIIKVCINFIDGGGEENIAVNGQPIKVLQNFLAIDGEEIAPGVTATVIQSTNLDLLGGTLCLSGNIQNLTIGGQEMLLDNLCFYTNDNDNNSGCRIKDLIVRPKPCTPNNIFFAEMAFRFDSVGNSGYLVYINGEEYGAFSYDQAFPILGPLDNGVLYEIVVKDKEKPDCKAFAKIGPINCAAECSISNLQVRITHCDNNGNDDDDDNDNGDDDDGNDDDGNDDDDDDNGGDDDDNGGDDDGNDDDDDDNGDDDDGNDDDDDDNGGDDDGNNDDDDDNSGDDDSNSCSITDLSATVLGCNGDGTFRLKLDFDHQFNTNTSFKVVFRGDVVGEFNTSQLPLTLENLRGDDTPHTEDIKVCFDNEDCCEEVVFMLPNCGDTDDDNSNDDYCLYLNFDYGNDFLSFDVFINGNRIGTFSCDQLPINLNQIGIQGDTSNVVVKVVVNNVLDCSLSDTIQVSTDDCSLRNPRKDDLECIGDGKYRVTIDFDHDGNGEFFTLKSQGGFEGVFKYSELPLRLPLPVTENGLEKLFICDKQNPDCCTSLEFQLPCSSNGDECRIKNLAAEAVDCNDGKFWLKIGFLSENTGGSGYFVFVDGYIFGPYNYNQNNIVVGPIQANDYGIYDVLLLDIDDPSCYDYIELFNVECDDDDDDTCAITNLMATPLGCNDDGTFRLKLDFDHQLNANANFKVVFRGDVVGEFNTSQLPITLENLRGDDTPHVEDIKVCLTNSDCCREVEFMLPNCNGGSGDSCAIYDVHANVLACDTTGAFYVKLHFEKEHPGNKGFNIYVNGVLFEDSLSYDLDTITLGPLAGDGVSDYDILIKDNQKPDCYALVSIEAPNCPIEEVWPGDANVDNVVSNYDLLNIGIAYGFQGIARNNQGNEWEGVPAKPWNQFFEDGVNYAHADANGDGLVDVNDRAALEQNYRLTHGPVQPFSPLPGTDIDPPIFVELPNDGNLPNGLDFTAPVVLGSPNEPVYDIYGIAFTIEFDPSVIDPSSLRISYPSGWFGTQNEDMITFDRTFAEEGRIEVAITRTNQTNVSGYGVVALLSGIIDDIAGRSISAIRIKNVYGINAHQKPTPFRTPTQLLQVKTNVEEVGKLDVRLSLRLIPNPTSDWVLVYTKYKLPIHAIEVLDANGKPVGKNAVETDRISLEGLPQGVYMLRLKIGEYTIYERVVKM